MFTHKIVLCVSLIDVWKKFSNNSFHRGIKTARRLLYIDQQHHFWVTEQIRAWLAFFRMVDDRENLPTVRLAGNTFTPKYFHPHIYIHPQFSVLDNSELFQQNHWFKYWQWQYRYINCHSTEQSWLCTYSWLCLVQSLSTTKLKQKREQVTEWPQHPIPQLPRPPTATATTYGRLRIKPQSCAVDCEQPW